MELHQDRTLSRGVTDHEKSERRQMMPKIQKSGLLRACKNAMSGWSPDEHHECGERADARTWDASGNLNSYKIVYWCVRLLDRFMPPEIQRRQENPRM